MPSDPHLMPLSVFDFLDYGDGTLKKKTGLGRFFKNMGARRSGRKYVYKQHEGDLHASEITMPEDDRIELMLLVKEGKISMHDAVETVSTRLSQEFPSNYKQYRQFQFQGSDVKA